MSEFIRHAAEQRADETLDGRERFADVAGAVQSRGGRARRSGNAFTDGLAADRRRR